MSREERILATIACRSVIKLGDKLSYNEMEALIKEWLSRCYPATCPHGRSIYYRLDHKDIAPRLDRHWASICQRLALPEVIRPSEYAYTEAER